MDRDQLRIEALKLAHADIFPGMKGDAALVIERATAYAKWLLTEHDTDAKGPDYAARQKEFVKEGYARVQTGLIQRDVVLQGAVGHDAGKAAIAGLNPDGTPPGYGGVPLKPNANSQ